MSYVLVFLFGAGLGYVGAWIQNNPDSAKAKWAELKALFQKKTP